MKRKIILETICSLLILLFVYTASSKLVDLHKTYHEMDNQPFPNWMTPFLVWGISLAELCTAGLLIFEKTKKSGLWASLILMSVFTGYIVAILLHAFNRVPCSCGGVIKQLGWMNHLYFNLFFITISGIALILLQKRPKIKKSSQFQQVAIT